MITVVEPGFEILTDIDGIEQHIERCGRTCYKSEDRITDGSAERFVRNICRNRHESVLEHASITVLIKCSRACSHQIVRHRLNSFSQESQRYVKVIKPKITISNVDDIIAAYLKGLSCKRIADLSNGNFTEWQVYQNLRKNNIARRNHGSQGVVYHSVFSEINSAEKAYLLGVILADGNVSNGEQLTLTQHRENIWYLKRMFQEFIQPDVRLYQDNGNCQRLRVHSQQIVTDLMRLGIVPNKTQNMTEADSKRLWSAIPPEFLPDFLRGFLDGDGSVRFTLQGNPAKTRQYQISWLGHSHTLNLIKNWCQQQYNYTCATINKISGTKQLYGYTVSNPTVIEELCNALFKNFQYPFGHPAKTTKILQQYNYNAPIFSAKDGMQVILPPSLHRTSSLWTWYESMEQAAETYSNLLLQGCKPEDARYVLPNATKTEIAMTCNLRQWRHVFQMRALNKHAQWEIRSIFSDLLEEFQQMMPSIFDDLGEA